MQNQFEQFYQEHLSHYGDSAQGVGWKNTEAQQVRFEQLMKVVKLSSSFVINDLGCGVGDLVPFLDSRKFSYTYRGYDVMPEMVRRARERFSAKTTVQFSAIKDPDEMAEADFTVASGIFNIRFAETEERWLQYILRTITDMNEKSRRGFAFNVLTKYSDAEFMKPELYYADPCLLFDHCKKKFSKNVALLHDYDQFDFTIIVRKSL